MLARRTCGLGSSPAAGSVQQPRDSHHREQAPPLEARPHPRGVLPARLADLGGHFDFLEEADDRCFAEFGFPNGDTPSEGIPYFWVIQVFDGTSIRAKQRALVSMVVVGIAHIALTTRAVDF